MAAKKSGTSKKEKELKEKLNASKDEVKSLKAEVKKLSKKLSENDIEVLDDKYLNIRLAVGDLHPTVLDWFVKKNKTKEVRIQRLHEAVRIGLLAQMQGRIGHAINSYKQHLNEEMSLLANYTNIFEQKFLTDNKFKTDQE